MKFPILPTDVIVYILEFDNKIKYRNSKSMNQIQIDDKTHILLKSISLSNKRYLSEFCF
jgi:hypothetical protein